jgi:hypothetical protein
MFLNKAADKPSDLLKKETIVILEGCGFVTVNVNFSDHPSVGIDWNDDLRPGFN